MSRRVIRRTITEKDSSALVEQLFSMIAAGPVEMTVERREGGRRLLVRISQRGIDDANSDAKLDASPPNKG